MKMFSSLGIALILLCAPSAIFAQSIGFEVYGVPVEFELSSRSNGVQDEAGVIGHFSHVDNLISDFSQEVGVEIRVITTNADNPQELANAALARSEEPIDDIIWVISFQEVPDEGPEEEGSGEGALEALTGFISDRAESVGLVGPEMEFAGYGFATGERVSEYISDSNQARLLDLASSITYETAEDDIHGLVQHTVTSASTYEPPTPFPSWLVIFFVLLVLGIVYPPLGSFLLDIFFIFALFGGGDGDSGFGGGGGGFGGGGASGGW